MNLFYKIIEQLYFRIPGNLALFDHTGLHNRNWWETIGKKKYMNKKVYVSMIDINDLKKINDNYGHEIGDKIIQNVSSQIKLLFPNDDTVHLGGDEFLVLTRKNPINALMAMSKESCFGCVVKSEDMSIRYACKLADKKMYEMKNENKIGR